MDFEENLEAGGEEAAEGGDEGAGFLFGFNEEEAQELKSLKDSVIFLIDCKKSMLLPNNANPKSLSNIYTVFEAAVSFMKTKIISSDNDRIGIILYSSKLTSNSLNFNNICVLQELEAPDASQIKELQDIVLNANFKQVYGSAQTESNLFEALTICHTEFKKIEKLSFSKRIFLFTDEDNPNADNRHNQQRAVQRGQDLSQLNVDIELFPLTNPSHAEFSFNMKRFYADLISIDEEEINEMYCKESSETRFLELLKRIRQKEFRKRVLGKTLFQLSPKMKIGIKMYNLVQEAKKPSGKFVDARSNKPLKSTSKWICEETGSVLYESQIGNFFPYGGEKALISKEEMKQIKKFDSVGLKLMGFKDRSKLKDNHNIRSSYFITWNDKSVTNSSQVMNALIKQMIAQDKMGIVRFIPRQTSVVRFCALLPQLEHYDEEDNYLTPEGFHLIFLPYSDDMRNPENILPQLGNKPDPSRAQIQSAKLLIKNLTIDFDSRNFENPSIQKFYTSLQALALQEQEPEEYEDLLEPDYEGMSKFAEIIEKFRDETFGGFDFRSVMSKKPAAGGKRGAAAAGASKPPAKKKKPAASEKSPVEEEKKSKKAAPKKKAAGDADWEINDEALKAKFTGGAVKKCTVPVLKGYCKERGLKVTGKKQDLLDVLEDYLARK